MVALTLAKGNRSTENETGLLYFLTKFSADHDEIWYHIETIWSKNSSTDHA